MNILLKPRSRSRIWYFLAAVLTIMAGLASRHFSQVLPACLGKYPGDALWALMVFFGLGGVFCKVSSLQLSIGALGFSFGIEVLKLCDVPWLVSIRHTGLGHLIFGSVFSWQNLVAYFVGIAIGLMIEICVMANPGRSRGKDVD